MPINNLEGIQVDMIKVFQWMNNQTMEDYDRMISRLQAMPTQINQIIALMEMGISNSVTYHEYSMVFKWVI